MKTYKRYCDDTIAHKMYHAIGTRCPCVYECIVCETQMGKTPNECLHKKSEMVRFWEDGCSVDVICADCAEWASEIAEGNPNTEELE